MTVADRQTDVALTRKEIGRLAYDWIGVEGGYLGSFSYRTHDRFWTDVCDREVNTGGFAGTTRECFEETLFTVSTREQAAVLRAILEKYEGPIDPVDPKRRRFRSAAFHTEILGWITRLELGEVPIAVELESANETVRRALDDADTLIRVSGPQSAVDRVHTALHGYLLSLVPKDALDKTGERPSMTQLFKLIRTSSPLLSHVGVRDQDIVRILGAMATILDALNPVRNNASVAHPNDELVGEPEARLVVNTARTLLIYFEAKRRSITAG